MGEGFTKPFVIDDSKVCFSICEHYMAIFTSYGKAFDAFELIEFALQSRVKCLIGQHGVDFVNKQFGACSPQRSLRRSLALEVGDKHRDSELLHT